MNDAMHLLFHDLSKQALNHAILPQISHLEMNASPILQEYCNIAIDYCKNIAIKNIAKILQYFEDIAIYQEYCNIARILPCYKNIERIFAIL